MNRHVARVGSSRRPFCYVKNFGNETRVFRYRMSPDIVTVGIGRVQQIRVRTQRQSMDARLLLQIFKILNHLFQSPMFIDGHDCPTAWRAPEISSIDCVGGVVVGDQVD